MKKEKAKTSQKIPHHVAVIMDGNGRWAKERNLSRSEGHKAGAQVIDELLDVAIEYNINVISLYAFSTENWKRPKTEINGLFQLLNYFIKDKLPRMLANDIRMIVSGDIKKLPIASRRLIEDAQAQTAKGKSLTVNFCLNYGSQQEILRAASLVLQERVQKQKNLSAAIKEKEFARYLYTAKLPPVDLLIRTAGEKRLSNFLLYQSAYAELVFTDVLWPNFDRKEFIAAIEEFQNRTRKFGGLTETQ